MRRIVILAALTAIAAAGCGVRPTGPISAGAAPTAEATALPESRLFFVRSGTLVPVTRAVSPTDGQAVFNALLAGPTPAERARGLSTALTGVAGIEVVSALKDNLVVLRISPDDPLAVKDSIGLTSKIGFEQIACTGQALASHPVAVNLLPVDSAAGTPVAPANVLCDRAAVPQPQPWPR